MVCYHSVAGAETVRFREDFARVKNRVSHSEARFANPDHVSAPTVAALPYTGARQPARARLAHRTLRAPARPNSPTLSEKRSPSYPHATSNDGGSCHPKGNSKNRERQSPSGSNASKPPTDYHLNSGTHPNHRAPFTNVWHRTLSTTSSIIAINIPYNSRIRF